MSVIIKGTKVGKTNITSTYGISSDSKELTVVAIPLETMSKPEDSVYSGNEQKPKPVITVNIQDDIITLEDGTDYILSYTNNINVGQAIVVATGIGNYTGTLTQTWNITPADISVTYDSEQSYVYDGTLKGYGILSSSSMKDDVMIKYGKEYGVYDLNVAPQIKNVNESGLIYFQATANNHNVFEGYYSIEITPKIAELSWGDTIWVYDGNEHSTTCTVSNLVDNDVCEVVLLYNSITNIGNVNVCASDLSNENYIIQDGVFWKEIKVIPGMFTRISGTWTPVKSVYKKVSGQWVKQDMTSSFSTSEYYVKK